MIDTPSRSRRSRNSSTIAIRNDASTIETGSSATISAGPGISALAIATRCNCPPDSSCANRPAISASVSPTLRSASSARPRAASPTAPVNAAAVANRYRSIVLSGLNASNGF